MPNKGDREGSKGGMAGSTRTRMQSSIMVLEHGSSNSMVVRQHATRTRTKAKGSRNITGLEERAVQTDKSAFIGSFAYLHGTI
jgi:hypothetical protein